MTCDSKNSNKQTPCIVFPVGVFDLGFTISNLVVFHAHKETHKSSWYVYQPLLHPMGHYDLTYLYTFVAIGYFYKV